MLRKKEIMERLCNVEIEFDTINVMLEDCLKRLKKLEKTAKTTKTTTKKAKK